IAKIISNDANGFYLYQLTFNDALEFAQTSDYWDGLNPKPRTVSDALLDAKKHLQKGIHITDATGNLIKEILV
ncbi:hypothetical protein ACI3PL_24150, partial [Lacticaseibacillus paracasei]